MTDTILILTDIGFSKRDYQRMGIDILQKKFKVEVFDFTNLFSPNFYKTSEENTYRYENYYEMKSLEEAYRSIETRKVFLAIDWLGVSDNSVKLREFLRTKKIKLLFYQNGLVPNIKRTFYEKCHKAFFLFFKDNKKFFLTLKSKIFSKLLLRKNLSNAPQEKFSYDYIIVSGKKGLRNIKSKKIIEAHGMNYETFLNSKNKKDIDKKNYAVFLDQYLPYHPGASYSNQKPKCTKEKYYPSLNNFFSELEKIYSLKVIVCAHPRSRWDLKPDHFEKREIINNKTVELVKNSKIVIAHTSTSISYAVLFKKPLLFLTTNEILVSYDDFRVNSLARDLGSTLINIDSIKGLKSFINSKDIFKVDIKKYEKYRDDFIKIPGSENISVWDILSKNLKI